MKYQEHVEFTETVQGGSSDEEFYERADRAEEEAEKAAIDVALKFIPDVDHVVTASIPCEFGVRWAKSINGTRDRLLENHGERTIELVRLAARFFEFARWNGAGLMARLLAARTEQEPADNESLSRWLPLTTADGYADREGWANVAYNEIASTSKPHELLSGSPFAEYPQDGAMLEACGLIWFFEAARLQESSDPHAMHCLFESSEVLRNAEGEYMWAAGHGLAAEESASGAIGDKFDRDVVKSYAGALAKRRHTENYAMIDYALKYWRENIDPTLSASKAANELVRVVRLSHKKLAEVVSAEKKKQP